jgi:hypothetical protein
MMDKESINVVKSSPFQNTYGGLDLVKNGEGKLFLRMQDCSGNDYYGPLTQDQVSAFYVLCELKEVE